MTLTVATGIPGPQEAELILALDDAPVPASVTRRCADAVELLAVIEAGLARVAVVSAGLPGLDHAAAARLAAAGAVTIELRPPGASGASGFPATLAAPDVGAVLALLPAIAGAGVSPEAPDAPRDDPSPHHGVVIAVWGPHGAPGRTTVAVNIAASLARHAPGEVLLIDGDPQGGAVTATLALLDDGAGLAAAARKARSGQLNAHSLNALTLAAGEFACLAGLADGDKWHLISPAAIPEVVGVARTAASYIVVDVGSGLADDRAGAARGAGGDAITMAFLRACDHTVVVGSCDTVGLLRLLTCLPQLAKRSHGTRDTLTVALNKLRPGATGSRSPRALVDLVRQHTTAAHVLTLPWDLAACDKALLGGRTLPEAAPASPLTGAIARLASTVARAAGAPLPQGETPGHLWHAPWRRAVRRTGALAPKPAGAAQ